jgi:hypothetical protein
MTRTEELVRLTAHAIAGTVSQVRPLRLPEGADELAVNAAQGLPSVTGTVNPVPFRLDGGVRRRQARWRTWGAPVAAAATVIALAVSLVIIKDAPNGSGVSPAGQARVPSGVPKYFVEVARNPDQGGGTQLLVGDTLTGKTLATVAPPSGTRFLSVWGAADDRTFAVFAQPAGGSGQSAWYLLRLNPGSAPLAKLRYLPVNALSSVLAAGLSSSGKELAVARKAGPKAAPWLGIYSVATGRLLRSWSAHGTPTLRLKEFGSRKLTWTNSDRAITFLTMQLGNSGVQRMWRLNVATTGGDLVKDSQVIWSASREGCGLLTEPLASADGKTVVCGELRVPRKISGELYWVIRWLAYPTAGPATPRVLYQATVITPLNTALGVNTWWVNASGTTLLVDWTALRSPRAQPSEHFGMISHGTFTLLKAPPVAGLTMFTPPDIAY